MKSPTIVLKTSKFADDRLIVETYTEEAGAQSFVVRVSHGRRTGIKHTLFQPLALIEMEWQENQRRSLLKPTAARPLLIPHSLYTDPIKSMLTLFLAEFLRAVLRSEPPTRALYAYSSYAVRWLDAVDDRPVANFHLAVMVRMAHFLGIMPNAAELENFCPVQYRGVAPSLLRMNLANQHLYQFTRAQRAEFLRMVLLYYRTHQTAFPELKSVEVLTEMFN